MCGGLQNSANQFTITESQCRSSNFNIILNAEKLI